MALIVQKFGGTSLATIEHIKKAANLIATAKAAGHHLVVIVSAMSGETDRLVKLAKQINLIPDAREYAVLLTTGEQVSMALMSMILMELNIKAKSYTGWQANIITDDNFKKAKIESINPQKILADLANDHVVVIAGFQGVDVNGNITILGRGGSDTTAVAIAAALQADECQIYTDVEGIYTADPKLVPNAKKLDQISFAEILELASLGAKVLQIRAVEFAGKYKIPVRVLSSSDMGEGTLITYEPRKNLISSCVTGIACTNNDAKISLIGIPDAPGIAAQIVAEFSALDINIDMLVQYLAENNTSDFIFTVAGDEYVAMLQHAKKVATRLNAVEVKTVTNLAKISIVGVGLKNHPEIAHQIFNTLAQLNINILLIATSEIKISILIEGLSLEKATFALHETFRLGD